MRLSNNTDLYHDLLVLGDLLAEKGSQKLAERVRLAARQGTGLSTEFLGESRNALKHVLDAENGILLAHERDELSSVIGQVEIALRREGCNVRRAWEAAPWVSETDPFSMD